jgi:hypothetical protein
MKFKIMILKLGGKLLDGLGIPNSAMVRKKCRSQARVVRMQDSYRQNSVPQSGEIIFYADN